MTAAYEIRQCNEYGKLGLMGVTILYSSGDNGVAGFDGFCIDPATGEETANGTRFDPGMGLGGNRKTHMLIADARFSCQLPIRYCR